MKKIIVFTSRGGGGHLTVSQALEQQLQSEYHVQSVYALNDIVATVDPVQQLTFGYFKGEDAYNYLLKYQWTKTLSVALKVMLGYFSWRKKSIKKKLTEYLTHENPDLVISVFHLFNNVLLEVTKELDIPFLLIPTDLDVTPFLHGIKNPDHPRFRLALAFEKPEIKERITRYHIPEKQLVVTGFPVRKQFFSSPDSKDVLRATFGLPVDKKIVMILMGAQGSQALLEYARQLARIDYPIHIVFCLGRNERLAHKITQVTFNNGVTYTCLGFTQEIPKLMQLCDLIITKSGSVSVCEALYAQLPMILDGTHTILEWEAFNHRFIEQYGLGASLRTKRDVCDLIKKWLNSEDLIMMHDRLRTFGKYNGLEQIESLIHTML